MKKRFICSIVSVAMAAVLLSGCAGGNGSSDDEAKESTSLFEKNEDSKEESADALNTGEQSVNTEFKVINHSVSCKVDGKELATGTYPTIVLPDEYLDKYPKLALSIDDFNEHYSKSTLETVSEYASWAKMDTFNENVTYTSENEATIVRADDKLFTLMMNCYDFSGGVHPNHWTTVMNVIPETGEEPRLDQVLDDYSNLSEAIRVKLEAEYPGISEEIDTYYYNDGTGDPDVFKNKLKEDTYTWTIDGNGLTLHFSPYEIASYAAGDMVAVLPTSEYPNLIKKEYQMDATQDMESLVIKEEAEVIEVEPSEDDGIAEAGGEMEEESSHDFDYDYVVISNPTWKKYVSEKAKPAASKHVSLKLKTEDKSDWLDTEVWANKNGFTVASLNHGDENYYYEGANPYEFDYMYNELMIYNASKDKVLYDLGFHVLCNGPDDEENKESTSTEYLNWAQIVDDTLYVGIKHAGYASENSWSNYVAAIDLETKELLWRSEPLANNSDKFVIVDDTIICGYGFTSEPDYIYLLDRFTGDRVDKIKVNSAPYQFEVVGDTLYVATYNTAYEFEIVR